MFIADAHCDALWKMLAMKQPSFNGSSPLRVNTSSLKKGNVKIQNFALYTSVKDSLSRQKKNIMKELYLFKKYIAGNNLIKWTPWKPIQLTPFHTNAILSLEGAGMFGDNLHEWKNLKENGVEMASLTWNEKNELAAGSSQSNKYGLTKAGKKVIAWQNQNHMVVDAAHLNERSFWDVLEHAKHVAVSHANVKALYDHPRNLSDQQIEALAKQNSFIGLTFYPRFINGSNSAVFTDLARQIDYLCSKGAENIIGFGSDFDGIDTTIKGLESPADFPRLLEWLSKHFNEKIIQGIAGVNFHHFWTRKRTKQ
ncbi:dipeptidase [Alteribacillus bidgolensis]|uniref:Membrane dipeptidase n=1 Tax=Alteribacillus bidgolensis TaxID=930129 RepID=A0A1G8D4K4_9BACI|nr:membrane dipeptidase [Alteribacillus bidgolensis]SDH52140.1 membrane dipeptidase [Alteribacillus bidgolensis]